MPADHALLDLSASLATYRAPVLPSASAAESLAQGELTGSTAHLLAILARHLGGDRDRADALELAQRRDLIVDERCGSDMSKRCFDAQSSGEMTSVTPNVLAIAGT